MCQYSDAQAVWKKGSLLHKNAHLAIFRQSRDKELLLRVQGPRPENILFMVHEVRRVCAGENRSRDGHNVAHTTENVQVLETLIGEFFHGVVYDLSIPCVDCVRQGSQDPHMFSAKQVHTPSASVSSIVKCAGETRRAIGGRLPAVHQEL